MIRSVSREPIGGRAATDTVMSPARDSCLKERRCRDEAETEALVVPIFERMSEGALPGADWIVEQCGVDING